MRSLKLVSVFLLLYLVSFSLISADTKHKVSIIGARKPTTVSDKKILKIEKIIYSYLDKGSDITNSEVKQAIISDINNLYKIEPEAKPYIVNLVKINKKAETQANERFPLTKKQLEKKYKKIADTKFQPAKINSVITLTYNQGPYKRTISGRYYGLTYYNDGVKIENTIVPIFDLSEADKNKFDATLREFKKKSFIDDKILEYQENKDLLTKQYRRDEIKILVDKNEQSGFIFAWGKWRTPEAVANIMINYISAQVKLEKEDES